MMRTQPPCADALTLAGMGRAGSDCEDDFLAHHFHCIQEVQYEDIRPRPRVACFAAPLPNELMRPSGRKWPVAQALCRPSRNSTVFHWVRRHRDGPSLHILAR
jgi:hypothetical protein